MSLRSFSALFFNKQLTGFCDGTRFLLFKIMDEKQLLEEKKRLEDQLKNLCPKAESEYKREVIQLLEEYNSMKDATQRLIGGLANIENRTVKEIHERLNLRAED